MSGRHRPIDIVLVVSPDLTSVERWLMPECLGIYGIDSFLKSHGVHSKVVDAYFHRWTPEVVAQRILRLSPQHVALQLMSPWTTELVVATAKSIRAAGFGGTIGVGGNYASLDWSYLLKTYPEIDYVAVGEAEYSLLSLIRKGSISESVPGLAIRGFSDPLLARRAVALDDLPPPSRPYGRLLTRIGVPMALSYSRGCYRRCEFCTVASFSGIDRAIPPWRSRSAGSVYSEIRDLHSRFGADQFLFVDDNFVGPRPEHKEDLRVFASLMSELERDVVFGMETHPRDVDLPLFADLKRAGLAFVAIGFETYSTSQLRNMKKGSSPGIIDDALAILKELRVPSYLNTILVDDRSTLSDLERTLVFLENNLTDQTFNLIGHMEARIGTEMLHRIHGEYNLDERKRPHYAMHDEKLRSVSRILLSAMGANYSLTQDLWRLLWLEWRALFKLDALHEISPSSITRQLVAEKNRFTIELVRHVLEKGYGMADGEIPEFIRDIRAQVDEFRTSFVQKIELCFMWVSYLCQQSGKSFPQFKSTRTSIMPNFDVDQLWLARMQLER